MVSARNPFTPAPKMEHIAKMERGEMEGEQGQPYTRMSKGEFMKRLGKL